MSYSDVLVHLDYTKACPERIRAATALAKRTGPRPKGGALALQSTTHNYLGLPLKPALDATHKKALE